MSTFVVAKPKARWPNGHLAFLPELVVATAAVPIPAERLNRYWIGIDRNLTAIETARERLGVVKREDMLGQNTNAP